MFEIDDDKTLHLTRGDIAQIEIKAEDTEEKPHQFSKGDIIRLVVYGKGEDENVYLQKDVEVSGNTTAVDMFLTKNDTEIGEAISKSKEYCYKFVLNPENAPQTFIGHDEGGPKRIMLYP